MVELINDIKPYNEKVIAIITTHNDKLKLEKLLISLNKQEKIVKLDVNIFVSGYNEEIIDFIKKFKYARGDLSFIIHSDNVGPTNARNIQLMNHYHDYILFLDDDVILPKLTVFNLLDCLINAEIPIKNQTHKLAAVGPLISNHSDNRFRRIITEDELISFNEKINNDIKLHISNSLNGCCYMIKSTILNEIGFINNNLIFWGHDDFYLSKELSKHNFLSATIDNVLVYHAETNKTRSGWSKYFLSYIYHTNLYIINSTKGNWWERNKINDVNYQTLERILYNTNYHKCSAKEKLLIDNLRKRNYYETDLIGMELI